MWCGTFKAQEKIEREFLALQAIQVIKKMCQQSQNGRDHDLVTYVLLMLQVVFVAGKPELLTYFVELWKYDLQLPTSPIFEFYDFKANERRTTYNTAA